MNLKNKKVLVTGGGSGIGKALAQAFGKAGASHVALVGRTVRKLQDVAETLSCKTLVVEADIARSGDRRRMVDTVAKELGGLDVLVNCAGIVSAGSLEKVSDDDVVAMIAINLTGLILTTKGFLPALKRSDEAAIVNVSSGIGMVGMPFYSVYAAAKGGVAKFSESLRRELTGTSVRVLTLYPTATDTPMMAKTGAGEMEDPTDVAEATIEGLLANAYEVVRGGPDRQTLVKRNFETPLEVDEIYASKLDALRQRAESHRSV